MTPQQIDDAIERAYWQFDARRKGLAQWSGAPQSERDAFKLAMCELWPIAEYNGEQRVRNAGHN